MRSEGISQEKLQCDLASLLPEVQEDSNAKLNLFPNQVKLEDLEDIELPPANEKHEANLAIPADNFPGLIDGLTSEETCSDLVSTFVSDAGSGPVSLDDYFAI